MVVRNISISGPDMNTIEMQAEGFWMDTSSNGARGTTDPE
jgi:hypothetical protein